LGWRHHPRKELELVCCVFSVPHRYKFKPLIRLDIILHYAEISSIQIGKNKLSIIEGIAAAGAYLALAPQFVVTATA
jgi:hypothetical protein